MYAAEAGKMSEPGERREDRAGCTIPGDGFPVSPFTMLLSLLELSRWHSALGAGIAVWVGGNIAGAVWGWEWLYPMSIAVLLSAAGNAYNDTNDIAADIVNRPTRPIPRGAVSVLQARSLAVGCAFLALIMALPLGAATMTGALVGILLLFLYSPYLKSIPLIGNGVVGLLVGMCIGFGGLLAGNVAAVLLPGAAVGLLFGGREVLKTLYDVVGDTATGIPTVATQWGERGAVILATICFGGAITAFSVWAGIRPSVWPVPFLATTLVGFIIVPLWHHPERSTIHRALRRSKVLGLVLLLLLSFL